MCMLEHTRIYGSYATDGKEVVTHITHVMYGKKEGSFTVAHI